MANRFMTGTTCGTGQIVTFIASDNQVTLNSFFQFSSGECVEITSTGATTSSDVTRTLAIKFASCAACLAPYSANTEQIICYLCNSDVNSGTATWNTFVPPHPKWTDNQGHAVSQMNAVTIGGNGLNS